MSRVDEDGEIDVDYSGGYGSSVDTNPNGEDDLY